MSSYIFPRFLQSVSSKSGRIEISHIINLFIHCCIAVLLPEAKCYVRCSSRTKLHESNMCFISADIEPCRQIFEERLYFNKVCFAYASWTVNHVQNIQLFTFTLYL